MTAGSARARSQGQSLAEFALVIPVLLAVLLMGVDLGRVYLGWVNLNNVSRIGANFAAQNPDAWQGSGKPSVQARYRTLMTSDATSINCTLPSPLPAPMFPDAAPRKYAVGSRVRVDLTCSFPLLTPMLSSLIGDGAGNLPVRSSTTFTIRFGSPQSAPIGGNSPTPTPTATATATATATSSASPTATPSSSGSPGPTASPTATPLPVSVGFYGTPTSSDSYGGGPPGSVDESQIVGISSLAVTFTNTTIGVQGSCLWEFGDGGTSSSCGNTVSYTYSTRGTYSVTLTVNGVPLARTSYVLVGCKVPAFAGVRKNSATGAWIGAGFASGNLTTQPGTGNYKIGYQSLAGGIVNPPGGCSGAQVQVGP